MGVVEPNLGSLGRENRLKNREVADCDWGETGDGGGEEVDAAAVRRLALILGLGCAVVVPGTLTIPSLTPYLRTRSSKRAFGCA